MMMTMLRFGTKERRPCCTAAKVQSQRCSRCTRQLRQLGQRNAQSKEGCVSKRGTPGQHRHAAGVQPNGARVFEQAVIGNQLENLIYRKKIDSKVCVGRIEKLTPSAACHDSALMPRKRSMDK